MAQPFATNPLYLASNLIVVAVVLTSIAIKYVYTTPQLETCNASFGERDTKRSARLAAMEGRMEKIQSREAALRVRDPELVKKLYEQLKSTK